MAPPERVACAPQDLAEDEEDLFVDESFPAARSVLAEGAPEGTAWRRPRDLCDEPQVLLETICRNGVLQGEIDNCWSMAACAAVAEKPSLIRRIVPCGQILHGPGYSGRIVIRIWHMNHWHDVEIDDRLPVNEDNELLYARSVNNQFWMPLIEKALAKFHGGYQNLAGGQIPEGFINLTGYSVRNINVKEFQEIKNQFFKLLKTEQDNGALITCARGGISTRGLPSRHGFTVTDMHHLRSPNHRVRLLRVRNPWGDVEWTGDWSDGHSVWKEVDEETKKLLGYEESRNGEFWMKLVDFLEMFEEVCIASRKPSVHEEKILPSTNVQVKGSHWIKGKTAGGPFENPTFADNPQFLLYVEEDGPEEGAEEETDGAPKDPAENEESDEETQGSEGNEDGANETDGRPQCAEDADCEEDGVPVLVELLQDHNRRFTTELLPIGFTIFKTRDMNELWPVGKEKRLTDAQLEVCQRLAPIVMAQEAQSAVHDYFHLLAGERYVVVPHTEQEGQERCFLVRVFARNAHVHLHELGDRPGNVSSTCDCHDARSDAS